MWVILSLLIPKYENRVFPIYRHPQTCIHLSVHIPGADADKLDLLLPSSIQLERCDIDVQEPSQCWRPHQSAWKGLETQGRDTL